MYQKGFTLIELSIVLVIIGLIIGGILVGQDLISAAGTRATIAQIEKYNSATNTFVTKYGYLPGDIPATQAASFSFVTGSGTVGQGDGNGIIAGYWGGWGHAVGYGETAAFWKDLATAGFIDGSFSSDGMTAGPDVTGTTIAQYLPQAKLGGGNYIYVWSMGTCLPSCYTSLGPNYFGMSAVSLIANTSNDGKITSTTGLSVQQANVIDTKIDDGMPATGKVVAMFVSGDPVWSYTGTDALYNPLPTTLGYNSSTCFDNT